MVREGMHVMMISTGGTVIRMAGGGDQAARALDPGRERDAVAGRRAGLDARAGGRGEPNGERTKSLDARRGMAGSTARTARSQTNSTPTSTRTQPTSPRSRGGRRGRVGRSAGRAQARRPPLPATTRCAHAAPSSSPAASVTRGAITSLQWSASSPTVAESNQALSGAPPAPPASRRKLGPRRRRLGKAWARAREAVLLTGKRRGTRSS